MGSKWKRIAVVMSLAAFVALFAAACGSGGDDTGTSASATSGGESSGGETEKFVAEPQAAAERVAGRLADRGLVPSDVFGIFGESFEALAVNHPEATIRAESMRHFEALLEFARRLGAPGVTILPGTPFAGVDKDESLALAAVELERRARVANEAGLRFSVEPHVGSITPDPEQTLALLERAESVRLALDLSHFAYLGIGQADASPLFARTAHVHLRQAGPGRIQARVGEGTIDFPRLRDELAASGYDGYLALEYQWEEGELDFTRVDCIAETAALRDLVLGG